MGEEVEEHEADLLGLGATVDEGVIEAAARRVGELESASPAYAVLTEKLLEVQAKAVRDTEHFQGEAHVLLVLLGAVQAHPSPVSIRMPQAGSRLPQELLGETGHQRIPRMA